MSDLPVVQDTENLPQADNQKINQIVDSIKLDDPSLSVTYGTEVMQNISRFSDEMLQRVRAKDAGQVGETLTNLLLRVKDVDLSKLGEQQKGFLSNLPLIGSLFDSAQRSLARFKTLADQVEEISGQLEKAMVGLLYDVQLLEKLYEHNREFHQDLSLYIEAGKRRLEHARTVELPKLQAEAQASADSMIAQKVRDFADQINRFERRLHDLQLSRTITLQTAPQIRLLQSNDQTLAEKIQTSLLSTIPIWKSQMVLALTLEGQRNAAQLQKNVADTTNELLKQNAQMLQQSTVETAREVERSIVDIETLRDVQAKLISTIEETLRIAQDGREKRNLAEKELTQMEKDLRQKLTSLAVEKVQGSIKNALGENSRESAVPELPSSDTSDKGSTSS